VPPPTHAGVVVVIALAGKDDAGGTVGIGHDTAIAMVVRTKGVAEGRGALGFQFVVVVFIVVRPEAALEQRDAQAGHRQFLGDNPAPGAGADDYGINFGQGHTRWDSMGWR
jgi:hypothetical protein